MPPSGELPAKVALKSPLPPSGRSKPAPAAAAGPVVDVLGAVGVAAGDPFVGLEEDVGAVGRGAAVGRVRSSGRPEARGRSRRPRPAGRFGAEVALVDVRFAASVSALASFSLVVKTARSPPSSVPRNCGVEAFARARRRSPDRGAETSVVVSAREVADVDVEGAVLVGAVELLARAEEDDAAVGATPPGSEAGVEFAVAATLAGAAGAPLRDQDRPVFGQVAHVDVFRVVVVAGDQRLLGREEDFAAVARHPVEDGRLGVVAAHRADRDLAGHVFAEPGVEGAHVDVVPDRCRRAPSARWC